MSLATRNNGCDECCKRRLKCDKSEPECLKCLKSGLKCSGQGLRYRHSHHVIQGHIKPKSTKKSPAATSASTHSRPSFVSPLPSTSSICDNGAKVPPRRHKGYRWVDTGDKLKKRYPKSRVKLSPAIDEDISSESTENPSEDYTYYTPGDTAVGYLLPSLPPTPSEASHPQTRMLFHHCKFLFRSYPPGDGVLTMCFVSESVARVMVVLDSQGNGYRDIILPLACQDTVLERAVSVVAAFHLAQKTPRMREIAQAGQQAIIEKLRQDSQLLRPPELFSPFTLATILVLLVGETITGADNYVYLLEMLQCITRSPNSLSSLPPDQREFFLQQIKMFELFGFTLSNETRGLETVTRPIGHFLDFMSYPRLRENSEDHTNISLMKAAIEDACGIYRRRAESSLRQDESVHLVDQLRQKVIPLKHNVQGAHALVWTYFIAAAESTLPEHRQFFTQRLNELYSYTRFGTIPAALGFLETIWALQGSVRWTEMVGTMLVM